MANKKRVLLIGLDGMTHDVMKPLADSGVMPYCKTLMDRGAWGVLESTVPPVTGPAWTSFSTGKQPGNHGIFDFFKPTRAKNRVGMSRRLVNSKEIDGKTLWQILTDHGLTSIVMNVPVTYPPRPLKGGMFTGMLTPSVDHDLTYPPDLYKRLRADIGEDYVITVNWQGYSDATASEFIKDLMSCQRIRTKYCLRLMDEFPDWDLCFPCYTGTDRIQHAMWHYIDPKEQAKLKAEGRFDQSLMDMIHQYYRQVDDEIRQVHEKAGDAEVPIFFVSDHGFGPLYGKFYANNFLKRKGLLVVNEWKIRRAMVGVLWFKIQGKIFKTIGMRSVWKRMQAKKAADRSSAAARTFYDVFYESVDWKKTKAYMASNTEGGLYINTQGRRLYGPDIDRGSVAPEDYLKVREQVIDALREIRHPDTGKPMLSHVEPRENVYHGKYLERAPDIVFFLDNGEWIADFSLGRGMFKAADWRTGSGTHRMDGCFLACGPGVKHREGVNTSIINVTPTILAVLGLPIPADMDGKFIDEAFTDEWKAQNKVEYAGSSSDEAGQGWGEGEAVYDEDDEGALLDRLRGLGYIE